MINKKVAVGVLLGVVAATSSVLASTSGPSVGDYPSVWNCNNPKFNWYCDDEPVTVQPAPPVTQVQPKIDVTKMKTSKEVREALETLKDRAVMEPTEQNIKDYVEAQQYVFEKGSVFADTWRRVVWTNPELDYTLRRPVNNSAIRSYDTQRDQSESAHLKMLAKEHGLMFFFRSDCPFCHQLAPTLKNLSRQYGIEILPVSLDGGGLPDFPRPKANSGQAASLGIQRVPAVFIASRKTGDMAPIGYGVMSMSEIINRIFVLTNTKPGETF